MEQSGSSLNHHSPGLAWVVERIIRRPPRIAPLLLLALAGCDQQSAGIGVMGGMIAATVIGVFFVPLLFVTVRRLFRGREATADQPISADPAAESAT